MLDFNEGATPLYTQIAYDICNKIVSGVYPLNTYLPSQHLLCEEYGVSRITIIKSIKFLSDKNIIETKQGKGCKVIRQNLFKNTYVVEGFSSQFNKQGINTTTKVISIKAITPDPFICNKLGVKADESIIELRRVRYFNDKPVCFECAYYKDVSPFSSVCFSIQDNESLYAKLNQVGMHPLYAEEKMSAVVSSDQISKLLEIPKNTPLLKITRKTFFENNNEPLEYCINHYNTNTYGDYGIVTINFKSQKEDK